MATEPLPSSLSAYRPTPNEKEAYSYLFNKADTDSLGVLTGDLAVPFFSHSSLPPVLLGEIWQIADPDNSGFLSPERFGVACRLIGHAQDRAKTGAPRVEASWVGQPGPLPTFKGSPIPAHLLPPSSHQQQPPTPTSPSAVSPPPASRIAPQTTGVDLNTVKPDDKAKYARLFASANGGNVAGLLDGDKARDIFIKSNLPYETLGQIWNLADTHSRGSLDLTDFTIGMHLLQHVLNGHLGSTAAPNLPTVLDPKLYASAAGLPAPGVVAAATGGAAPASPLRQSSMPVPPPPAVAGAGGWVITPAEKAESDLWFDQLDTAVPKKGVLEGEQAVGFFGQSGLDVAVLAKVWDLADLRNEGHLNKDTFAVAMKLIRDKVANPIADLPEFLPADFIPPSMRTAAPAAAPPVPAGPQRDLLDLMDDEPPAAPARGASTPQPPGAFAPLQPQSTGSSLRSPLRTLSPQRTGSRAATLSPQATGSGSAFQLQGTIFPQATGGSTTTARQAQGALSAQVTGQQQPQQSGFGGNFAPAPTSSTFFDDNDDADTAANLSSLRSRAATLSSEQEQLTTQLSSTRQSREELESAVQSTTQQINELQSKVAASRASLETERSLLEDLKRRDAEQKAVLARARTELISAESDLSAVRMEKTEVEGEVLRDKEDVREVKRRLGMVEEEKRILREEVEKVRKEQRREKGLGAIARKQLATAEADRGRLEHELEEAKNALPVDEVPEQQKEINPVAAAAIPLPITPDFASPTASIRSNNPFDRLTAAAGVTPQSTGSGSSSSKNPFPSFSAPSPQPPTPAPEPPTTSQATEAVSFPVAAAAAAVGTGALAAIGAAGAGLASALGVSHRPEEEPAQEPEGTDPFGVPARTAEQDAAAADGFGDDFGASSFDAGFAAPAATTAAPGQQAEGTLGELPASAGFDEAFQDLAAPTQDTQEKEVEVVERKLGEVDPQAGFDEAFAEFGGDPEEQGVKKEEVAEGELGHIEPGAGFEDAFKELKAEDPSAQDEAAMELEEEDEARGEKEGKEEELDKSKDKEADAISAPQGEEEDIFGGGAARAIEDADADDSDSSDDEGPEDLDGAFGTRRSPPAPPTAAEHREPEHEPKTTSESDESYVHVPAPGTGTGTAESSQILEPPAPPAAPIQHRRAAPPPPTRPAAPPAQDDFESSFADMSIGPSSSSFATAVEAPVDTPTSAKQQPDFDSFDADFDFKPSFENETPAAKDLTGAGAGSRAGTGSGSNEFDDAAFAEFDSSFPSIVPSSAAGAGGDAFPPVSSSTEPEPAGFSFDDSFGAPPFSPSPSIAAEPGPPVGLAPPAPMVRRPSVGKGDARDDDSDDVKQICGMGFSREMAIEALAKYDHDLNRAINSLL
ncbi:hypothetical protein JCM1841_005437 [Sporobolomyces salmonicolor]